MASLKAKINYWLRWLLVLPAAFVVGLILVALLAPVRLDYYGLAAVQASSLFVPFAYVGVGAWMAPSSRFRVAVVLAVLTIYNLALAYWPKLPLAQLRPYSDVLVASIALNAVGLVAALFLVRRLSRSRVQTSA